MIKLEDRLHYLLQPSLESLLGRAVAGDSLAAVSLISSKAWPFSIRGTRRSWPTRWAWARRCRRSRPSACCCAAARSQSVLLVCPKPLVTNWQREFALWAPRFPLLVDRRRQARRQLAMAAARRAGADRQLRSPAAATASRGGAARRRGRCTSTWWCSTNRSGSRTAPAHTSQVVRAIGRAAELGPDRHARGKQPRRPGGHLRVSGPRLPLARDEAAADGPDGQRLRAAADQGPGAHRPAAQDVSRRRAGADAPSSARPISWPRTRACCG